MKRLIGTAVLALLLWHQSAGAMLVSMDFTFPNINFADLSGTGSGDVVFRVSYDSAASDGNSDPSIGAYDGTASVITGGVTSPTVPASIVVTSGLDEFSVFPNNFSPRVLVFGTQIENANFTLQAPASQMFTSDALPLTPSFASNATAFVRIDTGDASRSFEFGQGQFQVESLPVPEPTAYILVMAGLLGILIVRRTRITP